MFFFFVLFFSDHPSGLCIVHGSIHGTGHGSGLCLWVYWTLERFSDVGLRKYIINEALLMPNRKPPGTIVYLLWTEHIVSKCPLMCIDY